MFFIFPVTGSRTWVPDDDDLENRNLPSPTLHISSETDTRILCRGPNLQMWIYRHKLSDSTNEDDELVLLDSSVTHLTSTVHRCFCRTTSHTIKATICEQGTQHAQICFIILKSVASCAMIFYKIFLANFDQSFVNEFKMFPSFLLTF